MTEVGLSSNHNGVNHVDVKAGKAATRIQRAFKLYRMERERKKRNKQKHREQHSFRNSDGSNSKSLSFTLKVTLLILSWYTMSTILTVFNKVVYGAEHGKFPAPLLVTGSGMVIQFFLCRFFFIVAKMREGFSIREALADSNPNSHLQGDEQSSWMWFKRYAPVSFMTGLDYGASNLSLVYITLSFYTMCKSSSPLFLLLFAFLLRLEQPSWKLTGIMGTIMLGVMLSVYGELKFNALGFFLVFSAAFLSGCRWGYVQLLLQQGSWLGKGQNLNNSVVTLYNMVPLMSGIVLFFSIVVERPWQLVGTSEYFSSGKDLTITVGFILFSGTIAFMMVVAEFVLVAETSAVTFTVAGALKELLTIFAGVVLFGDKLTIINCSGLFLLIIGVALYNYYKLQKSGKGADPNRLNGIQMESLNGKEENQDLLSDQPISSDPVFSLYEDEFDEDQP